MCRSSCTRAATAASSSAACALSAASPEPRRRRRAQRRGRRRTAYSCGVAERRDGDGDAPVLYTPDAARIERAVVTHFQAHVQDTRGLRFGSYADLWTWSVTELEDFWRALWEFFDVQADGDPARVLTTRELPGARWFPGVSLSYAE